MLGMGSNVTMVREPIGAYYDRLTRWTGLARLVGYGGGREALTAHRRLADPLAGRQTTTRLHDVLLDVLALAEAPRVLDAGCGMGGTMIDLARRVGGTYTGVTLSRAQAAIATRAVRRMGLVDRVRVIVGSYDHPPDGPFDLIVAIESLAHSVDPAATLRALCRELAPGGLLAIVDDMPEPANGASNDLQVFKRGWHCPVLWPAARYTEACASLGLTVEAERDLTSECRPRARDRIRRLEVVNRVAYRAIPLASWRALMDSHQGGLALERLYLDGLMRYRLLVARRP
jgi:SAM-dependent methyltransferase